MAYMDILLHPRKWKNEYMYFAERWLRDYEASLTRGGYYVKCEGKGLSIILVCIMGEFNRYFSFGVDLYTSTKI